MAIQASVHTSLRRRNLGLQWKLVKSLPSPIARAEGFQSVPETSPSAQTLSTRGLITSRRDPC